MVSHNPQYWRLDQFNLICYGSPDNPIFKNTAGRAEFDSGRLFGFTDPEIKGYYKDDISKLAYLPTIVVAELGSAPVVPARLARIFNIHNGGNGNIAFEYRHLDDDITSEAVFNSGLFPLDRDRWQTRRTHWAIKRGDLLEWIFNRQKEKDVLAKPRFFEVGEWPMPKRHDIAIMMPFAAEFDPVYEAIKAACDNAKATPIRVDEIYTPSKIANDIFAAIAQSRLVVCDLTGRNPNVLYETGLAHALNAEVVMLTQNGDDVPFDLRHFRYFPYLNNGEGLRELQVVLERTIRECLGK